MRLKEIFKKIFFEWEWICAYRSIRASEDSPFILNNKKPFQIIDIKKGYWAADPFLISRDEEVYCFFEYYSKKKRKAALGCKNVLNPKSEVEIVYEFDCHSSYPSVFNYNGRFYMIPETKSLKSIVLLENIEWPNKWEQKGVLLDNVEAVDSTPFVMNEKMYLFIYQEPTGNKEDNILQIAELDVEASRLFNIKEVKRYNKFEGRPGGRVVFCNNKYYRIVQPSRDHYGEKIEIYEFSYSNGIYKEELVYDICPEIVALNRNVGINGIHTFNSDGEYQVIDVLTKGKFSITRPFKWIFCKLGWFGFDDCDKKKIRVFKHDI